MQHIPLYLRRDAKAQFDDLISSSECFRRNIGAIHHLVACYTARLRDKEEYLSRTKVHTESLSTRSGGILAVDFRIEDGPSVIIEAYAIEK